MVMEMCKDCGTEKSFVSKVGGYGETLMCECSNWFIPVHGKVRRSRISEQRKPEMVNHPKHYNDHPTGIECIEVVRHMNFNIGNAIKYLWRAGLKDQETEVEDLEKAIFYIQDEIERVRGSALRD